MTKYDHEEGEEISDKREVADIDSTIWDRKGDLKKSYEDSLQLPISKSPISKSPEYKYGNPYQERRVVLDGPITQSDERSTE